MKLDGEKESVWRIQNYARSTIENSRYQKELCAIVLRDLIWDGCIESGAFGQLNPATRQRMMKATLKELAESKTNEWLTPRVGD